MRCEECWGEERPCENEGCKVMDGIYSHLNGECGACRRERYARENPKAMIPLNAIAHTCRDEFDLYEKRIVCADESREVQLEMIERLVNFAYDTHPGMEYYRIRWTDSERVLNAKEVRMEWAVRRAR
jgi:hypothetical protein